MEVSVTFDTMTRIQKRRRKNSYKKYKKWWSGWVRVVEGGRGEVGRWRGGEVGRWGGEVDKERENVVRVKLGKAMEGWPGEGDVKVLVNLWCAASFPDYE